ncbi:MAG TPA: pitrilysin family protein [Pyrinomonadaceae bacterium]|nr:pitrilysin family protein [Pyrinomonadaceae bacterium]
MRSLPSKLFLFKLAIFACFCAGAPLATSAQTPIEPDRSELLNGLRVILLSRPGEPDVLIKLRVHSGSAFDLAGKAGATALLGDILFPDPNTREYFTEEMQGRLNISTDYDSITITMQGRAREFERIIEILRTAVVTPQLTPDNFSKARDGRVKVLKETAISPGMLADRAIAARLFGDFPYGRPVNGTVESLERVLHTDLMLVRDRFLNPNNATVAIVGGVQPSRALRALRQLLGGWRKSEQIVPTTFRQPVDPDPRILVVGAPGDQSLEVRLAVRGLARKDPDSVAVALLTKVMHERWEKALPELSRGPVFVRHDALMLPGMLVMGATAEHLIAGKVLGTAQDVMKSLVASPVSNAELEQAKLETLTAWNKERSTPEGMVNAWLDTDTYGVVSAAEQMRVMNGVTPNDLRRVAERLFRNAAIASVVVGNSELAKASVERYGKVELLGEVGSRDSTRPTQPPSQPQIKTRPE